MASAAINPQRLRVPLYKATKHVRNGPKSYARAMAKFQHLSSHRAQVKVAAAAAPSQGDRVPATDIEHDAEYLCPVEIGTPAQKLMLDFDTGSSDLWVWSTKLPSNVKSQYGSQHTIYDSTKSNTFKNSSGSTWSISYGDGSTSSGTVGTDTVAIGSVTIKDQAVELADTLSEQFQQGEGDGLLGLAFPEINTVKPKPVATPVANMISQDDIPKGSELFTAWLSSDKSGSTSTNGSWYTFGFIDSEALSSTGVQAADIKYTPVDNSNGFWEFPSTSAKVNDQTIQLDGNTAIADTGTTLALVSDDVCSALYKAIPGAKLDQQQGGYVFPTNTPESKLPTLQVAVGDTLYTINKSEFAFADAGNGMSYGGVQSRGSMPLDILGDVFLKGVYAVFDQGNKRFGAVPRAEASN